MTDHVARMVQTWFARAQDSGNERESITELVDAIHRMLREAEDDIRRRCEEVATQVAGPDLGGRVALAIRTADPESLPRKSLTEIYAPEISASPRAQ